jgi:predicted pyridoxine 5'-phosphate oxidase superfamily flavin-nucleotide-binding protein
MKIENPYHEGELQVQARVGVLDEGAMNSRVIQDSIIKGALRFINQLPMAVFGSLDQEENVWASVFVGTPGFMQAEDERLVNFDLTTMVHNPHDPFWKNIQENPQVGMLAIELASRRRLRINGTITRESDELLQLQVKESYPNCPKYIQRRQVSTPLQGANMTSHISAQGDVLGSEQQAIIAKADTFFVASDHPERGVDASHRGGNPGFVTLIDDHTLRIPDYPGNSMFNTLGNFTANARAGLIFLDFNSHRTLQLTGRPEILYDVKGTTEETGGTNRHWQFHIEHWLEISQAQQLDWSFQDYSPYNLPVSNNIDA